MTYETSHTRTRLLKCTPLPVSESEPSRDGAFFLPFSVRLCRIVDLSCSPVSPVMSVRLEGKYSVSGSVFPSHSPNALSPRALSLRELDLGKERSSVSSREKIARLQ